MKNTERWVADAARRATLLEMAKLKLREAIETKDDKKILKMAEKLGESLR